MEMEGLLRALQSTNNNERDRAEKSFTDALKNDVRSAMNQLLQCVLVNPDPGICEVGAVLFRGQLAKRSVGDRWWETLQPVEKDGLRKAVLECLTSKPGAKLKRHITQLIAQIAYMSVDVQSTGAGGQAGVGVTIQDEWPTLLQELGALVAYKGDGGEVSNAAVMTLGELVKTCQAKFEDGNTLLLLQELLVGVLTNPFNGSNSNRIGAVFAMQQVLTFVEDEDAAHFAPGMAALMRSLEPIALCANPNEEHLLKWFENVIEVIQWQPTLFGPPGGNLRLGAELVGAMLKIAGAGQNGQFSDEVRRQSLEVVINLVCHIPAAVKDDVETVRAVLGACLTMMLESDDGPEEFDEDDELGNCANGSDDEELLGAGARGISSLCESFGEERTLPLLFPMVQQLLDPTLGGGNPASVSQAAHLEAWRRERAGLMALERAAYSGGKLMYGELKTILQRVLPFATNEACATKVRLCALDALCGVLVNFCEVEGMFVDDDDVDGDDAADDEEDRPNVQTLFAADLLAAVCGAITEPRVNSRAEWAIKAKGAYCVTTFCCGFDDGTGGEVLAPHATDILGKLHRLIELSGTVQGQQVAAGAGASVAFLDVVEVQKNCLESVGCMAKALGEGFAPYYDTFMPITKTVYQLQEQNAGGAGAAGKSGAGGGGGGRRNGGDKQSQLRGTALETICSMGLAAGREKFSQDAQSLVGMIVHYMDHIWSAGDADRNRQVAQLAVNICTWIDEVDQAVLAKIVPRFVEWSKVRACTLVDGEDDEDDDDEGIQRIEADYVDENGVTKPGYVVRNVYLVREKETAIRMLQELIAGLGESLMPWAGELAELMMKELRVGEAVTEEGEAESEEMFGQLSSTVDIEMCAAAAVAKLVDSTGAALRKQGLQYVSPAQRDFAQRMFYSGLTAVVNSLKNSFELAQEEDQQLMRDAELGKEFDEFEDYAADSLTTLSRQVTNILRAAFRSGGRSDEDVDVMLAPDYNPAALPPLFGVPEAEVRTWMDALVQLMRLSLDRPRGNPWWKDSHNIEVFDYLSEAVGYIIKAHGAVALPTFGELVLPLAMLLLEAPLVSADEKKKQKKGAPQAATVDVASSKGVSRKGKGTAAVTEGITAPLKADAVFFLCDAIEYGGEGIHVLVPQVVPYLLRFATSNNYILRQACCFGLGTCAEYGGANFTPFLQQSMQALVSVCDKPGSRKGNGASATDNAISALLKCVLFRNQTDGIAKVISYLPCSEDPIESRSMHYRLYRLMISNDPIWQPHHEAIKAVLRKAAEDTAGWDKGKGAFDEDFAILTKETRAWVKANL